MNHATNTYTTPQSHTASHRILEMADKPQDNAHDDPQDAPVEGRDEEWWPNEPKWPSALTIPITYQQVSEMNELDHTLSPDMRRTLELHQLSPLYPDAAEPTMEQTEVGKQLTAMRQRRIENAEQVLSSLNSLTVSRSPDANAAAECAESFRKAMAIFSDVNHHSVTPELASTLAKMKMRCEEVQALVEAQCDGCEPLEQPATTDDHAATLARDGEVQALIGEDGEEQESGQNG